MGLGPSLLQSAAVWLTWLSLEGRDLRVRGDRFREQRNLFRGWMVGLILVRIFDDARWRLLSLRSLRLDGEPRNITPSASRLYLNKTVLWKRSLEMMDEEGRYGGMGCHLLTQEVVERKHWCSSSSILSFRYFWGTVCVYDQRIEVVDFFYFSCPPRRTLCHAGKKGSWRFLACSQLRSLLCASRWLQLGIQNTASMCSVIYIQGKRRLVTISAHPCSSHQYA